MPISVKKEEDMQNGCEGFHVEVLKEVKVTTGMVTLQLATGDSDRPAQRVTMMIEDLTNASIHRHQRKGDSITRIFHVMVDNANAQGVAALKAMAYDCRAFYQSLQAEGSALKLPEPDAEGDDWWTPAERYLSAAAEVFQHAITVFPPPPHCCLKPCLSMILTEGAEEAGESAPRRVRSLAIGGVVHQQCPCSSVM
jgi:hypothetical protein